MNYTNIVLFLLGVLGILLHNLIEMNKINRANNGNINIANYLKIERFTIIISIIVVFVAILVKQEIKQVEAAGKWMGVAFVAIGYMGQSILIFAMGKAGKVIDSNKE